MNLISRVEKIERQRGAEMASDNVMVFTTIYSDTPEGDVVASGCVITPAFQVWFHLCENESQRTFMDRIIDEIGLQIGVYVEPAKNALREAFEVAE